VKKLPVQLLLLTHLAVSAGAQTLRVVNAASFMDGAELSPGSIITVLGSRLTNTTASARGSDLPRSLGGVTVTIGGMPSPLFYVSPTQVNAQIDPRVPLGPALVSLSSPTGVFTANITISANSPPGVFSLTGTGARDGAILNAVTFSPGAFSVTTGGKPTFLALFVTGLNASTPPVVTVGGIPVPVIFAGNAPGFAGLQQINVQLIDSLAGAGRIEIAVLNANGRKSNVVEMVILPKPGQGSFPTDRENESRSREIAAIAYIPLTSLALIADENDDVVRVIDAKQQKVVRTIVLPGDAEPVALAVNSTGTLALVAERNRNKIALIDLKTFMVTGEIAVGRGPVAVAVSGNNALVANQEDDTVSIVDIAAAKATTIPVGRAPRGVAIDSATNFGYVTNQGSGTISVIDIANRRILTTLILGVDARPAAIQVLPGTGFGFVTEPSAGPDGKVMVVNLGTGQFVSAKANPDRSGGSSDLVVVGTTAYFANQTGASVSVAPIAFSNGIPVFNSTTVNTGVGARAIAVDTKDNLLLVTSEGSGTITLIDLATRNVVGRIDAVRSEKSEKEDDEDDDHDDREHGGNLPVISTVSPASAKPGASFVLTVNGTNLIGATDLIFVDPEEFPGHGHGKAKGHDKNHPLTGRDSGFTVSNLVVNAAGTVLTALVQVAPGHAKAERVVRVLTPNGESSFQPVKANTFSVTP
jgi:uncharacterized protein (TIGR03437 family)